MKGKQVAIILLLLLALGAIALFLNQRNAASWSESATTSSGKVVDFQLNDVTQVTIREGTAELSLVKKDDLWGVKERADYPAAFEKVSSILRKLWELRPVQDVKVGPSQLGRLQLEEPGQGAGKGILVDLKGVGDKRLAALLLGKKHLKNQEQPAVEGGGFPMGRYVMGLDGANKAFLVSDTLDEVQTKPEQWLSRDFVRVENPKSIAVAGTAAGVNWKLTRDLATAPWKLTDLKPGEDLDNSKASAVASLFMSPSFTDVLPPDAPVSETGLDKPSTVKIETFDGFSYEFRIGKLNGENYPMLVSVRADLPKERTAAADEKPEDKEKLDQEFQTKQKQLTDKLEKEQKLPARPYVMMKSTVEQLLKDRASLMAEKKSPSPAASAAPAAPAVPLKPPVTPPQKKR